LERVIRPLTVHVPMREASKFFVNDWCQFFQSGFVALVPVR
jgi:hypothetical protein